MFDFVPYDLLFGGLLSPSRRDLVADVNPAKAPAPQADSDAGPNDFMSPRKVRACVGMCGPWREGDVGIDIKPLS